MKRHGFYKIVGVQVKYAEILKDINIILNEGLLRKLKNPAYITGVKRQLVIPLSSEESTQVEIISQNSQALDNLKGALGEQGILLLNNDGSYVLRVDLAAIHRAQQVVIDYPAHWELDSGLNQDEARQRFYDLHDKLPDLFLSGYFSEHTSQKYQPSIETVYKFLYVPSSTQTLSQEEFIEVSGFTELVSQHYNVNEMLKVWLSPESSMSRLLRKPSTLSPGEYLAYLSEFHSYEIQEWGLSSSKIHDDKGGVRQVPHQVLYNTSVFHVLAQDQRGRLYLNVRSKDAVAGLALPHEGDSGVSILHPLLTRRIAVLKEGKTLIPNDQLAFSSFHSEEVPVGPFLNTEDPLCSQGLIVSNVTAKYLLSDQCNLDDFVKVDKNLVLSGSHGTLLLASILTGIVLGKLRLTLPIFELIEKAEIDLPQQFRDIFGPTSL